MASARRTALDTRTGHAGGPAQTSQLEPLRAWSLCGWVVEALLGNVKCDAGRWGVAVSRIWGRLLAKAFGSAPVNTSASRLVTGEGAVVGLQGSGVAPWQSHRSGGRLALLLLLLQPLAQAQGTHTQHQAHHYHHQGQCHKNTHAKAQNLAAGHIVYA